MIDLHTHSTASDGSCTPERLIDLALEAGLSALALTDHDTLDGVAAARARSAGSGLRFFAGVEIEIDRDAEVGPRAEAKARPGAQPAQSNGEFHLLGLGLLERREALEAALVRLREARHARNVRMVEKLQRDGIPVSMEELNEMAGGKIISRAHFAKLFVRKKIVNSIDAAFSRLIGKGQAYYEPRACLALREAAALIHSAGGIAVVAHPVSLGLERAGAAPIPLFLQGPGGRRPGGLAPQPSAFGIPPVPAACRRARTPGDRWLGLPRRAHAAEETGERHRGARGSGRAP